MSTRTSTSREISRASSSPRNHVPGDRLAGRYRLVRLLGEGGLGKVWLAEDNPGELVALKILSPEAMASADSLQDEFAKLSRLLHPNIVRVHDFGLAEDGVPFFTMDWIDGRPLNDAVSAVDDCLPLLQGACAGLDAIHAAGFVHGDVKPSNLLVLGDPIETAEQLQIVDLSLAGQSGDPRRSRGTPGFAAPEVVEGDSPSTLSDLYGLGASFYTALSGRAPFIGRSLDQVLRAQSAEEASAIPLRAASVPEEIVRIVLRLLARDPRQRPRSATNVWEEIAPVARRKGVPSRKRALVMPSRGSWVGRTREIAVADARTSEGGLPTLVTGPNGVGRSRFLRELALRIELVGGRAFVVSCAGRADAGRECLRRLASMSGLDAAAGWSGALDALRGKGPIIVGLEDLQVASDADLEIARQALVSRAPDGVGVFLSWAEAQTSTSNAFEEFRLLARGTWIGESPRNVELHPLSRAESDELVRSMLAGQSLPAVEEAVWKQTGGNPAWIEGALFALSERGSLSKGSDGWRLGGHSDLTAPLPALERIHSSRLAELSSDAKRWLAALGCLGGEATVDRVNAVAECTDRDAVSSGMALIEDRNGTSWASAQPPAVGDMARRALPPNEHRNLCARAAETLVDRPLMAAELWLAADRPEVAATALSSALSLPLSISERWDVARTLLAAKERLGTVDLVDLEAAAAAAEDAYHSIDAAALWERYADQASRAEPDNLQAARGKLKAAESLRSLNEIDRATAILAETENELARLDNIVGSAELRSLLQSERSWLHLSVGRMNEAAECATRAIELAPESALSARFTGLNRLAAIFPRQGRLADAKRVIAQAFEVADRLGDPVALARIHANAATLARMQADSEKELQHLRAHTEIVEASSRWDLIARARTNLAIYVVRNGTVEDLRSTLIRAEDAARISGTVEILQTILHEAARLELRLGDLKAARRLTRSHLNLARKTGKQSDLGWAWNRLGVLSDIEGKQRKATQQFKRALRHWRTGALKEGTGYTLANLGELAMESDHPEAARRILDKAALQAREFPATAAWVTRPRAILAHKTNDGDLAERAILEGPPLESIKNDPASEGNILEAMAYRDAQRGNIDSAIEHWMRAEKVYRSREFPLARARCLARAGAALADTRTRSRERESLALEWLNEARAFFDRIGAVSPLQSTVASLNRIDRGFSKRGSEQLGGDEQALYEVSQLINSILDFPELLRRTLSVVAQRLGAERGLIALFDATTSELEPVGRFGEFDDDGHADALQVSTSILRRVAQSGSALHSDDALLDPQLRGVKSVYDLSLRSVLCVALRLREQVIGAIYLQNRSAPGAFSDRDIAFLESFSNSIAIAIENSRLHDSLRQTNDLLVDENVSLRREVKDFFRYANLVGRSSQMSEVQGLIDRFAQVDNDILILGETGTGKEVVAKTVHYNSTRKAKPFLSVSCVAFPESLIEAELFGIEDHVATGVRGRAGVFERAEGGTVLLDEIGDMALEVQAKLLRVLQEREFTRVGGKRSLKMNVRVFAATFRDLRQFVREEKFRADLYYRVNRLVINLPPLRDRKADVALLARHFAESFCKRAGRPMPKLSPRLLAVLARCPWKGNVRELEHYIERLIVMTDSAILEPIVLPPDLEDEETGAPLRASLATLPSGASPLEKAIQGYERELIQQALEKSGGNKTQAAKVLGLPEPTLRYRLRKLGLS